LGLFAEVIFSRWGESNPKPSAYWTNTTGPTHDNYNYTYVVISGVGT
jgi:hypothetical protein